MQPHSQLLLGTVARRNVAIKLNTDGSKADSVPITIKDSIIKKESQVKGKKNESLAQRIQHMIPGRTIYNEQEAFLNHVLPRMKREDHSGMFYLCYYES